METEIFRSYGFAWTIPPSKDAAVIMHPALKFIYRLNDRKGRVETKTPQPICGISIGVCYALPGWKNRFGPPRALPVSSVNTSGARLSDRPTCSEPLPIWPVQAQSATLQRSASLSLDGRNGRSPAALQTG